VAELARGSAHAHGPQGPGLEKEGSATRGPLTWSFPAVGVPNSGGWREASGTAAGPMDFWPPLLSLASITADEITVQLTSRPICNFVSHLDTSIDRSTQNMSVKHMFFVQKMRQLNIWSFIVTLLVRYGQSSE
jgi:hypothetical protein